VTGMEARDQGRVRRAISAACALLVLGAAVACCQQILSIDGPVVEAPEGGPLDANGPTPDVEDAGIDCGIPVPDGGCGACVTAQCCPQMSACAGDPQCLALETCLLACDSDYACRAACVEANPVGGQVEVPTLDTCVAVSCRGPCGMACGQAGSYTTPADAAPGCQGCIANSNACGPALACATSLACEIEGHCAYSCTTPDCRAACATDGSADGLLVNAALTAGVLCYGPCRVGGNWTCVNHVVWPEGDAGMQEATLTVTDQFDDSGVVVGPGPVGGVSAKACRAGDDPCMSPLSTGTTSDAGVVTLPELGSVVYLGFTGHFEMAAPGYPSNLYFLAFPLSQPNAQLGASLMSQATLTSLLAKVGLTAMPGRGHVWVTAADCLLLPASNVVVKADGLDPSARVVYFQNSSPSSTVTSTDPTGWAFIFNVPPGPLTVRAIPNATGVESSVATVSVRADAISAVTLVPAAMP
jgi:hypothetical protein